MRSSKNDNYRNFNVDLAKLSAKNIMYDFAKEMHFDVKAQNIKSNRDRMILIIFESPGSMVLASRIPTRFLQSDHKKLCDRLNILLQENKLKIFLI